MDINELKEFIIWCKEHKIKRIKYKSIEVEISDLALVEQYSQALPDEPRIDMDINPINTKNEYDPDILFHSSGA